ncbi:hypothetical protein WG66_009711 [Moniliophthora roreri]|nr:hypothetical protein WG66_009711 [Moniliophthora roreri]
MAANYGNHRDAIEAEAHNLAHRLNDILRCDHERIERERAEHLAKIASLSEELASLSLKFTDAQTRITTLTGVEAAFARTEEQHNSLRTQFDGVQKELDDTREANTDLKAKLDDTRNLLVDAYDETRTYKDKYTQLKTELIVAKQTGKAARKKMKKACSMLRDEDDMSAGVLTAIPG